MQAVLVFTTQQYVFAMNLMYIYVALAMGNALETVIAWSTRGVNDFSLENLKNNSIFHRSGNLTSWKWKGNSNWELEP
jgi:hypothetical protein